MSFLCPPAMLFAAFSGIQVFIDVYYHLFNTALVKVVISCIFIAALQLLCSQDLAMVAWVVVFIPIVCMTAIVGMILYIFGLDVMHGKVMDPSMNLVQIMTPPIPPPPFNQPAKPPSSSSSPPSSRPSSAKSTSSVNAAPPGIWQTKYTPSNQPVYYSVFPNYFVKPSTVQNNATNGV